MTIDKTKLKQYATVAAIAALVVYASNNRLPVLGSSVRRAIG